jgi:hypothetical protein
MQDGNFQKIQKAPLTELLIYLDFFGGQDGAYLIS